MFKDRFNQKRPHLTITTELIRSSLACLVIRNTGETPVSLKKIEFNDSFVSQLEYDSREKFSNNKINNMVIFPGKFWVMCLDTTISNIISQFDNTVLEISYSYSTMYKRKLFSEKTYIDFKQYSDCMVYISDIYDLVEENKKINNNLKRTCADLETIKNSVIEYADLNNLFIKRCISSLDIESDSSIKKVENSEE